ncbi:MAG TPA: nucleoside deaminase [Tepidisphaeraceae bacterium]|jgi:cytosine deaminase|nr:nucleoside deaminase [Tepidisphaeraceae bacterium]
MKVFIPDPPILIQTPAQRAASIAVEQAEIAFQSGTFGVGGLMIDNETTNVLALARNQVFANRQIVDPTGHVERQLVDWYYQQINAGAKLPNPEDITIVSSLDPCVMCCGAMLEAGFNVISVARDERAGVTYKALGDFSAVPVFLRSRARRKMAYFGVRGDRRRPYNGPRNAIFAGHYIEKNLVDRSSATFANSLKSVDIANRFVPGIENLKSLATVNRNGPLWAKLKKCSPHLQSLGLNAGQSVNANLAKLLLAESAKAKARGAGANAAALIAPDGYVLHVATDAKDKSPVRGAFMELTRGYAILRAEAGKPGTRYLPHPRHCKIVLLHGPGKDAIGFMQLGAVGSTMEGPVPPENRDWLTYLIPMQTKAELQKMVAALPPMYRRDIQVWPVQTDDAGALRTCRL